MLECMEELEEYVVEIEKEELLDNIVIQIHLLGLMWQMSMGFFYVDGDPMEMEVMVNVQLVDLVAMEEIEEWPVKVIIQLEVVEDMGQMEEMGDILVVLELEDVEVEAGMVVMVVMGVADPLMEHILVVEEAAVDMVEKPLVVIMEEVVEDILLEEEKVHGVVEVHMEKEEMELGITRC